VTLEKVLIKMSVFCIEGCDGSFPVTTLVFRSLSLTTKSDYSLVFKKIKPKKALQNPSPIKMQGSNILTYGQETNPLK